MTENFASFEYDEEDAVKYIQNYIPQELKEKITDVDINYIIDIMYDYYDQSGLFDDKKSDDELVELDEDELIAYVVKNVKQDQIKEYSDEEITFVVQGELSYCESIGMFD